MIRFVDLGTQLYLTDEPENRAFAFFNTVTSRFLKLDDDEIWESWEEFEESWNFWIKPYPSLARQWSLERFKALCQPWVFKK